MGEIKINKSAVNYLAANAIPAILSLFICGHAFADDSDDNKIYFTGSEISSGSSERVIHSNEIPNGIYITTNGIDESSYPNSNKLIRAVFKHRGIKLADQMNGSSVMVEFDFSGAINMDKAEDQASKLPVLTAGEETPNAGYAHSLSLQASEKTTYGSVLLGGVVAGNTMNTAMGAGGLLAAFLPTPAHNHESKVKVISYIWPNPELGKGFFGKVIVKETPDSKVNKMASYYYAPKVGYVFIPAETMMTILVTSVNQWIDRYMVLDSVTSIPLARLGGETN
ncbi:MAG: hypothetical protein NUV63_11875 [Gallionella sp.]|nr:hypothetical protein [Gallionella sp.]